MNTGNTAEACIKALGKGMVLTLASATSQERHVASLKSASPIAYDKDGKLIPLSERFDLKNKWLGRPMYYRPLEGIGIGERIATLMKETSQSADHAHVGYSDAVKTTAGTPGMASERTLFYDGHPIGTILSDADGIGRDYLLTVQVHPYDINGDALQGIGDRPLDSYYDDGCIRFDSEASLVAFYEEHREEVDFRMSRYNRIDEIAIKSGRDAAEQYSLDTPVQDIFKPQPPMRDWLYDPETNTLQQADADRREALVYRPGETIEVFKARNGLMGRDQDIAYYLWQKYGDRKDELTALLKDGITNDNIQDVARRVAAFVDAKEDGYEMRTLLNYISADNYNDFYNAYTAAYEARGQHAAYEEPQVIQGLEGYSIEDIKALVREHIVEQFADLMDYDVYVKDITIIGSRTRGEAREDSDLDILLEYGGQSWKEDAMHSLLHAVPMSIDGITVDIIPINEHYSLNTAQWLERDARWRKEDRQQAVAADSDKSIKDNHMDTLERLNTLLDEVMPRVGQRYDFPSGFMADDTESQHRFDILVTSLKRGHDGFMAGDDRDGYISVRHLSANEQAFIYKLVREHQVAAMIGEGHAMVFTGDGFLEFDNNTERGDGKAIISQLLARKGQLDIIGAVQNAVDGLIVAKLSNLSLDGMDAIYHHVSTLASRQSETLEQPTEEQHDSTLAVAASIGEADSRQTPMTILEKHYANVMGYYFEHHQELFPEQKEVFLELDRAVGRGDLAAWTSEVLTSNLLSRAAGIPAQVFDEIDMLAQHYAETVEDSQAEAVAKGMQSLSAVNEQRLYALTSSSDRIHEKHPDDIILFKSGSVLAAVGDDADKVRTLTGWNTATVHAGGADQSLVTLNSDGYEVLSETDANLRITSSPVSLAMVSSMVDMPLVHAQQTIDHKILFATDHPVSLETGEFLNIGKFKATGLEFNATSLGAVSDDGQRMVIRDIPTNYYHPEGTLVVADYINGHRETIENAIVMAQPVKAATYDDGSPKTILDDFYAIRDQHADQTVLLQQKGFVESFGPDAEKLSALFSLPLYERQIDGITEHFVMMDNKDYMELADAATVDLYVARPSVEDSRMAVSQSLVRMQEHIAADAAKKGLAAEIFRLEEGVYGIRLVHADTLHQVSNTIRLTDEEVRQYQSMTGPAAMSLRSDYVLEMADKYFGNVIRLSQEVPDVQEKVVSQETRQDTAKDLIDEKFNDFVENHQEEPLYAEASIRFKDDGAPQVMMFKLSDDIDPRTDNDIFFNVSSFDDFKKLLSEDNGQDFAITDIENIKFYGKGLYQDMEETAGQSQELSPRDERITFCKEIYDKYHTEAGGIDDFYGRHDILRDTPNLFIEELHPYMTQDEREHFFALVEKDETIWPEVRKAIASNKERYLHVQEQGSGLSAAEKEVIASIVRGDGNRADLMEGEEYDEFLKEIKDAEEQVMDLKPLTDRQRDILREFSNNYGDGLQELAAQLNMDIDYLGAALGDQQAQEKVFDRILDDNKDVFERMKEHSVSHETEGIQLVPDSQSPIFISDALFALNKIKQENATPEEWLKMLEQNGGIKAGEDRWIGLSQWLKDSQEKALTKADISAYLSENMIQVEEVHYVDHVSDKREIALTVPTIESWNSNDEIHFGEAGDGRAIARVRFSDEMTKDEKILVIDEIQGISDAPFEKNWHELAMKRMLRFATENGYDRIAWLDGQSEAERHDLAAVIDSVEVNYVDSETGSRDLTFHGAKDDWDYDVRTYDFTRPRSGEVVSGYINHTYSRIFKDFNGVTLDKVVGKELAASILAAQQGEIIPLNNISVGGDEMKSFYDKILPNFMNKYGKQWGVSVSDDVLSISDGGQINVHSVAITEQMKQDVLERLKNNPVNHETEEKPYRIVIGEDNLPGGVEGEYHVQFQPDIMEVTFGEQEDIAKECGGTMRVTDGQEWADFYDQSSAVKFADKVVAMNAERENAGNEIGKDEIIEEKQLEESHSTVNYLDAITALAKEVIPNSKDVCYLTADLDLGIENIDGAFYINKKHYELSFADEDRNNPNEGERIESLPLADFCQKYDMDSEVYGRLLAAGMARLIGEGNEIRFDINGLKPVIVDNDGESIQNVISGISVRKGCISFDETPVSSNLEPGDYSCAPSDLSIESMEKLLNSVKVAMNAERENAREVKSGIVYTIKLDEDGAESRYGIQFKDDMLPHVTDDDKQRLSESHDILSHNAINKTYFFADYEHAERFGEAVVSLNAERIVAMRENAVGVSTERERVIAGRYVDEGMYDSLMWPDTKLPSGYQSFGFEDMHIILYRNMHDKTGTPLSALPYEQQVTAMDIIDSCMDKHLAMKMTKALSDEVWKKLDGLLPENGDKLVLNEPFTISKADGLKDGITIEVKTVSRGISPDYERDIFLCGNGDKGINTFRMNRDDLQTLSAMVDGKQYTLFTAEKQDAMNAELREVKGSLRENAGNEHREQLRTLLGDVIGQHNDAMDIAPVTLSNGITVNYLSNNNGTILYDGHKDGGVLINRILDMSSLSADDVKALTASITATRDQQAEESAAQQESKAVGEQSAVREYSDKESTLVSDAVGQLTQTLVSEHYSMDGHDTAVADALKAYIVKDTATAHDAVYSIILSTFNKAESVRPGILAAWGVDDKEQVAEQHAKAIVAKAEQQVLPVQRENSVTATSTLMEREHAIAGRYAAEGMANACIWPSGNLPGGYQSFSFEPINMQIILYKDATDKKGTRLRDLPYEQQVAAMDLIDSDMDRHLATKAAKERSQENGEQAVKADSPAIDDVAGVKQVITDELTALDHDYYHTGIDFKAMVDDAKVESADDVKDVVSRLAKEMLYEADSKDYDLLSRYGHETGYVFDIDKETGVINNATLRFPDGGTEDLEEMKGQTLKSQIGKELAEQLLAMTKTGRIMTPILPENAGLKEWFDNLNVPDRDAKDIQMIIKSFKETADSPLKTTYTVKVNDDGGILLEAKNIAEDVAGKVKTQLAVVRENQADILAEKLMDLNAAVDALAKAERRHDPQYMMKKNIESYFIQAKPGDPSLVALCAVRAGDNEFVSSYITYPEQMTKIDNLISDVTKARQDIEAAKSDEKAERRQPVSIVLPDGREFSKANVFKLTQGSDAGKFALYGILDEHKTMKILDNAVPEQRALLTDYFSMLSSGRRTEALTALVNHFYGEKVQKASSDISEKPAAAVTPVAPAENHPRFVAMPSMTIPMSLLYHAISEVSEGRPFANPSYKAAPSLISGGEVSPWNALMMSLFSDVNGYRGNAFMMYDDGKAEGCHIIKGEKGLPFTAIDDSKYCNRHLENDIIDKDTYNAKDPKEQALYVMMPSHKTSNIFNIDQTSLFVDNAERYNALVNADVEQSGRSTNPYQQYYQAMRLEHINDVLVMKVSDSRFEIISPDLNKVSEILGKPVNKSEVITDNAVSGKEMMNVIVLSADDITDALRRLNSIDYRCVQFDPMSIDAIDSYDRQYPEKVYKPVADLISNLKTLDPGHVVSNQAFVTCYDASTGILSLNSSENAAPGEASAMALTRTEDIYRAVAAYLGSADILNRRASLQLLPDDVDKYDRLVQELSSAAMMVRRGYPATFSIENRDNYAYWLREIKECPALAQRLEADVNKTVSIIEAVTNGERVDYSLLRDLSSFDVVDERFYSIANELSSIPDSTLRQVVVIRDDKNSSAAVILPQGASQSVNNEADEMSRNRFILALRDKGIENVAFYNAGGMLALVKPNDFFTDKTAEVCRIDGYSLKTVDALSLDGEITRSRQVQLRQVELVPDNNDRSFLLIIPYEGNPLTVYPDKKDLMLLQDHSNMNDYDDIREAIGRKYYKMLVKHPELDLHLLSPATLGVDMHRISDVKISKDKANPGTYILSAVINGETFESRDLTPFEQRGLWLVSDTDMYKMCLAAQKFKDKLGIDEGLGDARFHTGAESASDACDQHERQPGGLGV